LPHCDPEKRIDVQIPVNGEADAAGRQHFDVRAFMAEHGLDGSIGGGAHMWRETWNEEVSKIYHELLSKMLRSVSQTGCPNKLAVEIDEPKFGFPPKADPYAGIKNVDKYAKSA
jgi:large subunit ribosomal protein L35